MTSALLKRGVGYLDTLTNELLLWMADREYDSIKQMQGSMCRNAVAQPARLRAHQLHEGAQLICDGGDEEGVSLAPQAAYLLSIYNVNAWITSVSIGTITMCGT